MSVPRYNFQKKQAEMYVFLCCTSKLQRTTVGFLTRETVGIGLLLIQTVDDLPTASGL